MLFRTGARVGVISRLLSVPYVFMFWERGSLPVVLSMGQWRFFPKKKIWICTL